MELQLRSIRVIHKVCVTRMDSICTVLYCGKDERFQWISNETKLFTYTSFLTRSPIDSAYQVFTGNPRTCVVYFFKSRWVRVTIVVLSDMREMTLMLIKFRKRSNAINAADAMYQYTIYAVVRCCCCDCVAKRCVGLWFSSRVHRVNTLRHSHARSRSVLIYLD